jgi:hypothetical protein
MPVFLKPSFGARFRLLKLTLGGKIEFYPASLADKKMVENHCFIVIQKILRYRWSSKRETNMLL